MTISEGATRLSEDAAVRETFESMPHPVVVLEGPEDRVVAANAAYRAMVGRAEIIGQPAREVFSAVAGQRIFELLDQVRSSGEPFSFREWRVGLVDDAGAPFEVFMDCDVLPRLRPDGSVLGITVLVGDATQRVLEQKASRAATVEAEQRYERARDVLAGLQRELLPASVPVLPGVRIAGSYLLADAETAAGGDWFDAVPLPDGRVALTVGDVVGHGVAASATMGQLRAVLSHTLAAGAGITAAMTAVDQMAARTRGARAATVCVAVLDPADGTLVYCTAGHPSPLLLPARGEPRFLAVTGGGPLGVGSTFPLRTDRLDEHDQVLLYTDGILERPGTTPSAATVELAQIAADVAAERTFRDGGPVVERVCTQTLELLVRGTGHSDDITLLAAARVPLVPALDVAHAAEPAAVPALRAALHGWLDDLGASQADGFAILHGVGELVANAVEHARAASAAVVALHAELTADGTVLAEVRDQGRWRRRDGAALLGAASPSSDAGRGRGLEMARGLVDGLQVEPGPDGTTVRITHRLAWPARLLTVEDVHSGAAPAPALRPHRAGLHLSARAATASADRRVEVDGPIDADTAHALEIELRRRTRGGTRPLTLDLTGATHLASAGVAVLHAVTGVRLYAPVGSVAQQVLALVALPHLTQDPGPASPADLLDVAGLDGDDVDDDEVHQATGVVMVQLGIPAADALARLHAHAFAHDQPLLDVAQDVIDGRLVFSPDMT